jgi:hypothetical protein
MDRAMQLTMSEREPLALCRKQNLEMSAIEVLHTAEARRFVALEVAPAS